LVFDPATGNLTGSLPEGTWVFQVLGTNALGNGAAKVIQIESYGSPAARWRAETFAGLDPAFADWNASPARDGIPNLLKYALGIPVFLSGAASRPLASLETHEGEDYFVFTIEKNPMATDVQLVPQISSDLTETGWNSGGNFLTILEDTPSTLKVRDNVPIRQRSRVFMRLEVTLLVP